MKHNIDVNPHNAFGQSETNQKDTGLKVDVLGQMKQILSSIHSSEFQQKVVDLDTAEEGDKIIAEYRRFFGFMEGLVYDEWPKDTLLKTPLKGGIFESRDLLMLKLGLEEGDVGQFFIPPENVDIDTGNRLDEAFKGSSADVVGARLNTGENIAAKVLRFNDLKYLGGTISELTSLVITSELGVGPKFYGFTEYNEKPVLLMEKIAGYEVEPRDGSDQASVYINQNSFDSFKKKMSILHDNGLCFSGDNGQYLVGKDGEVFFMDILLSKYEDSNGDQKKEYLERLADFVYPRVTVETLVNIPKDLVDDLKEVCGNDIIDNLLKLLKEGAEKGLLDDGFQFLQKELRRLDFSGVPKDVIGYRRVDEVMNEILSEIEKSISFISKVLSELADSIMANIKKGKVPQDSVDEYREVVKTLQYYSLNIKDIKVLFNNEDWKDYVRASLGDDSGRKKFDDACKVVLAVA